MPNADPRLVDQAIQWMITLRFNVADDASTAAFERWLHTSAEHQQVSSTAARSEPAISSPRLMTLHV